VFGRCASTNTVNPSIEISCDVPLLTTPIAGWRTDIPLILDSNSHWTGALTADTRSVAVTV
jgi:hypothetical protein